MTSPTLVILGANGTIGEHVIRAVLSSTFRDSYAFPIRVITRDASKAGSIVPSSEADLKFYQADYTSGKGLAEAFDGVDVVINLLGLDVPQNKVADAAAAANVKLYIPSEFGCDIPNVGEFIALVTPKIEELKYAKSLKLKTVSISAGAFSEWVYGVPPFLGVNYPEAGKLTYFGDVDTKLVVTSLVDVGKVVASIAAKDPSQVPNEVRIAGDIISPQTLSATYERASGQKLELVGYPLEAITVPATKLIEEGPKSEEDLFVGLGAIIATGGFYHEATENYFVSEGLFKFTSFETVGKNLFQQ